LTQAGEVRVVRAYLRCVRCGGGGCVLDERLGIAGRCSPAARRLICLAAASWSYDLSSERLQDLCGLSVSDTTIREVSQSEGGAMLAWQREEPEAARAFRESGGDVEFTTDGTCVNTMEGWREMKVGIFSKRDRGEPALPEEWATRGLPRPQCCVAFAAIEASDRFGSRWTSWRKRLGLREASAITVLADGAKWIWDEARERLREAEGTLDVFHCVEHIAATGNALHGEGAAAGKAWIDQGRRAVLSAGWGGIRDHVEASRAKGASTAGAAALTGLLNYLGNHQDHLHYRERLAEGRSIGSGQVEGACKNLIGKRLKQTSARWRVMRVNRMAGLCAVMYSDQWQTYWTPITT
jgi:hypothetical protein